MIFVRGSCPDNQIGEFMKCHICGNDTDFCCQACEEPVCEDCCVVPTYMNQIDYALCLECNDLNEAQYSIEKEAECELEEAKENEKEKRRKQRFENYHKPENVEKRRKAKIESNRLKVEHNIKVLEEVFKTVDSMIR